MDKEKIELGNNIHYSDNYVMLPVFLKIKSKIKFNKTVFQQRPEFHVSLFCLKNFPKLSESKIIKVSKDFLKIQTIKVNKISNNYYHIRREDRESIIVRVGVIGIRKYCQFLSKKLKTEISPPPTHITLYSLPGGKGIGVNRYSDLHKLGKKIFLHIKPKLLKS